MEVLHEPQQMDRLTRRGVAAGSLASSLGRGLITDQFKESGSFDVSWDARDDQGRQMAPGVYFFHLQTNRTRAVQRVVLVP